MSLSDEERSIVVGLEVEKAYVAYSSTTTIPSTATKAHTSCLATTTFAPENYPKNMAPCTAKWNPYEKKANTTVPTK